MQYTVLGKIHGKEIYLVPPQDVALLLEDRISPKLRKSPKQHNAVEGVGQLANHTCCDVHWNANLETRWVFPELRAGKVFGLISRSFAHHRD